MSVPFKKVELIEEKDSKDKVICVSIDFGTSRTGFAYGFVNDKSKKVVPHLEWDGMEGISYPKTLTKILYKDLSAVAWGFPAEKILAEVDEDDESYKLLKYFKMDLFKSEDGFITDPSVPENKFKVMDVIVDYLTLFHKKIKETLDELKIFDKDDIRWCLTIPAIWKDEQKEAMRIAAEKVGLVKSKNDSDLLLVLEPEAAAVYCLHKMADQGSPIKTGQTFVIVDAGGGTVDLTCHKVLENNKLKEIFGSGGDCGSSELDKNFWDFLYSNVEPTLLDNYKKDYPLDTFDFMCSWETTKCDITDFESKQTVTLPPSMKSVFKSSKIPMTRGGHLSLTPEVQKEIFEPTFKKIVKLVDDLLKETGKVDYIFIVGGFGESKALQSRIREEFSSKVNIRIFIPDGSSQAVVSGAVLMGLDDIISVRKMRRGYGVKGVDKFDSKKHKTEKKQLKNGEYYCTDIYDEFVQIGEEVPVSQVVKRSYGVVHKDQKSMLIEVYCSLFSNCKYVDETGVGKMGELIVDMSDTTGGINRKVEVEFKFGKTVFEFTATNLTTGKKYVADIKFGGKFFEYSGPKFVETPIPTSNYHM
jgi:hypothetical protein